MMNNAFLLVIPSAQPSTQTIHSSFSLHSLFLDRLAGFRDPLTNYLISQRGQRAIFDKNYKEKSLPGFCRGDGEGKEQLEHCFVAHMLQSTWGC